MKIGITCYPTYGGSGVVATELGKELAARDEHCQIRPHKDNVLAAWAQKRDEAKKAGRELPVT